MLFYIPTSMVQNPKIDIITIADGGHIALHLTHLNKYNHVVTKHLSDFSSFIPPLVI